MKRMIKGVSGKSASIEYIKCKLFDMLAEEGLEIDGIPANEAVDRVQDLRPIFDIDDVISRMDETGHEFSSVLVGLEEEADEI